MDSKHKILAQSERSFTFVFGHVVLHNLRFAHVIPRTRPSRFSICNIKSWEWPGDEARRNMHVAYCSMCSTLTIITKLGFSKVGECCRTICVCDIVGV